MDARTLSIRTVFGQDRRHVVPLFQRPHVWKRELQWEPLWNDIRHLAERLLAKKTMRPHFLGAVVLDQMLKPTGNLETRLVIDGQQRLTTIQIILETLSDICRQKHIDKYYKALLKLTRNDDPMSEDPDEIFKIWPTTVDQDHYRRVMRAESPNELCALYGKKAGSMMGVRRDICYFCYPARCLKVISRLSFCCATCLFLRLLKRSVGMDR